MSSLWSDVLGSGIGFDVHLRVGDISPALERLTAYLGARARGGASAVEV